MVVAPAAQVGQIPGRRSVENVEHQNARFIVCTSCVSKSEANVGGAVVVQRDYELALNRPDEQLWHGLHTLTAVP